MTKLTERTIATLLGLLALGLFVCGKGAHCDKVVVIVACNPNEVVSASKSDAMRIAV